MLASPVNMLFNRIACTSPTQETTENTWFIIEKNDVKVQVMACSLSDVTTEEGEEVAERGLSARQTNVCGAECAIIPLWLLAFQSCTPSELNR